MDQSQFGFNIARGTWNIRVPFVNGELQKNEPKNMKKRMARMKKSCNHGKNK